MSKTIGNLVEITSLIRTDDLTIERSADNYRFSPSILGDSPTLIVASSTATARILATADYVCDGVDDDVQIQAAIDALAVGGRILLSEGQFNLGDTIVLNATDDTYLGGMGPATVLRLIDGLNVDTAIRVITTERILIENLKIDSNGLNQLGNTRNIILNEVTDVIISQVICLNAATHGIEIVSSGAPCQDIIITGCIIEEFDTGDASNDGISISDDQFNVTIRSCILRHTATGSMARSGIEIEDGAHDVAITGCIIYGMENGVNMQIHGGEPAIYGVTVQSCTIYDVSTGIRLNGRTGVLIYGVTLSDNVIHNCGDGMNLTRAKCVIVGNAIFSNTAYGIIMYQCDYSTISSCWVWDNAEAGIGINQSDWNIITDCIIFENTKEGIVLYGAVTGSNRCIISGNQIIDNDEGDTNTYAGIEVSAASHNNLFQGNNFLVTGAGTRQTYGISLLAGATGNVAIDNQMTQGGRTGPLSDAGTNTVIRGNIGYVTENGGISGAIATGGTIAHGLAITPTIVHVNAAEAVPTDINISVDAANITVNFGGGGNRTFFWYARVSP